MADDRDLPIHASFVESVASPQVQDLLTDAAELTLDTITDDEVLKQLPIVRTLLAVKSVRDRFLLRKTYRFFARLRDMPQEEREAFVRKMRADPKQARKVGESFAVWLDRLDDEFKAELLARVFELFARGHIEFEQSARFAAVIDRAHLPYLLKIGSLNFMSGGRWAESDEDDIKSHLLAIGLVRVTGYGKDVQEQRDLRRDDKDIDFIKMELNADGFFFQHYIIDEIHKKQDDATG
jgi:hypothetical protein